MSYKILLVDDDSDDRAFFADAVAKTSDEISCITLSDGNLLLSTLAENGKPDVIFLDVNMPLLSGWDCLKLLKGHDTYKDIPVILYSTSKHHEEINKAKESGALCFYNKPTEFKGLITAIGDVLEHLQNGTINSLCENSKLFF